jgi:hypothetical protein
MRPNATCFGLILVTTMQGCALMPAADLGQKEVRAGEPQETRKPPIPLSEDATREITGKAGIGRDLVFVLAIDKQGNTVVLSPAGVQLQVVTFPLAVKQIDGPPLTSTLTFFSHSPTCPMVCSPPYHGNPPVCYRPPPGFC